MKIFVLKKQESAQESLNLSWWESEERIHSIIKVISRIPDSVCIKEEWLKVTVCWLLSAQWYNQMRQLLTVTHRRIAEQIENSAMIYELRHWRDLLLSKNERRQRVKDSISNKIWTLWIYCHAIWAEECTCDLSTTDQQYSQRISQ